MEDFGLSQVVGSDNIWLLLHSTLTPAEALTRLENAFCTVLSLRNEFYIFKKLKKNLGTKSFLDSKCDALDL